MYIGIGFDPNRDNECLTKIEGSAFVLSNHTIKKLEGSNVNGSIRQQQLKLICCIAEILADQYLKRIPLPQIPTCRTLSSNVQTV